MNLVPNIIVSLFFMSYSFVHAQTLPNGDGVVINPDQNHHGLLQIAQRMIEQNSTLLVTISILILVSLFFIFIWKSKVKSSN